MKSPFLSFLFLIPLLLTSCDPTQPTEVISLNRNGELHDVATLSSNSQVADYVRHTNSEEVLSMLENDESFIFYVGHSGCSACQAFKPNLLRYINETKVLVHYLTFDSLDDPDYEQYAEIWNAYQDIFLASIEFPYFMVFQDSSHYARGATSKMTAQTYEPFLNMMNILVKVNSIISIATFQTADYYLNNTSEAVFFFYDRQYDDAAKIYNNLIFPAASQSEKTLYLVDVRAFSLEDGVLLRETFNLGETIVPVAQRFLAGEYQESHHFGIDANMDQDFIVNYL
ncbi:MAG: hypothetical protein WC282_00910 [Bacilli bacterium]|jgi:predicted bacteriocin transport accessory protein